MCCEKLSPPLALLAVVLLLLVGCGATEAAPVISTVIPSTAASVSATEIPPTTKAVPPTEIPPTSTPVPATAIPPTSTPVPPTEIPPTAAPVLITSAEMLIGNWQPLNSSRDATFLQINSDGTCRQSFSLEGLKGIPEVECTYAFEGTNLLITAVKLNGVPECPSPTGKYEVELMAEDKIELVKTEDSCAPRARSTRGEYQRIS